MTLQELAEHWKITESEAKNISDFINRWYELGIVPLTENGKTCWQGVLYAYDPRNKYILRESTQKFFSREEAIFSWTNQMWHCQISAGQARQMRSGQGVPTDVYLALKPVQGYEIARKKRSFNASLTRLIKEKTC